MYKQKIPTKTTIRRNQSAEGEMIETKVKRILNNKEPIKDGAPIIYTERKEGILPQYDVRSDRMEIALEHMANIDKQHIARREGKATDKPIGEQAKEGMKKEGDTPAGEVTAN